MGRGGVVPAFIKPGHLPPWFFYEQEGSAAMPKHLLIDGFNVIRRDSHLSGVEQKNFYGAQELLIERMSHYRRGTQNRVTVVFDGRKGPNEYRSRTEKLDVQVIYSSQGETADEVIVDIVEHLQEKSGTLVVTADRDLAHSCRTLGVDVIPPEELIAHTRPKPLPPQGHDFWQGKREETGWSGSTRKKGNPRRLPKSKRRPSGLW